MNVTGVCSRRPTAAQVVMDTTLNVQDAPAPAQESAFNTVEYMKQMPGVGFGPFGYFDPLSTPASRTPP